MNTPATEGRCSHGCDISASTQALCVVDGHEAFDESESDVRAKLERALSFARQRAISERARGRSDEERTWLDMCTILDSDS